MVPVCELVIKRSGKDDTIVNGIELLVPRFVVTLTFAGPMDAFVPMVNVAVARESLTTLMLLTAIPLPASMLREFEKLVPDKVTLTVVPGAPRFCETAVKVGIVKTSPTLRMRPLDASAI